MLFCLTTVDAEMLFEVVFVLERFATLHTFELPGLHSLIQHDGTLGRRNAVISFTLEDVKGAISGLVEVWLR